MMCEASPDADVNVRRPYPMQDGKNVWSSVAHVIPAQAGIYACHLLWIPASAGMTKRTGMTGTQTRLTEYLG